MLDLDADPADAAALFERAAPDLGEPGGVWFEGGPDDGIARWRLRTPGGAFRLKVATAREGRARVRTGAAVLRALGRAGFPVPEVRRFVDEEPGGETSLSIETRGLDRDAATEWPRLGRPAREAVVDRWAEALARLHRLAPQAAGLAPLPGRVARDVRPAIVGEIADAVEAPRAQGLLPETFLKRVEIHLCRLVDEMPPDAAPAPCQGRPRLASVVLERRGFAAFRDFEHARMYDPLSDVALAALSLGGPGGGLARRFLAAYGAACTAAPGAAGGAPDRPLDGVPARTEEGLSLHVGLELLRCVTAAAAETTPEVTAAILDGLEAWLDEGIPAFR